jgi:glycerophosphoryl diester phosphodiesterase
MKTCTYRVRIPLVLSSLLLSLLGGCQSPLKGPIAILIDDLNGAKDRPIAEAISLGPRPFYLLDQLRAGPLRTQLETCRGGPFQPTRFSIGHRGAPLQFPEHTRASYLAAARMGAGTLECDVTFTQDRQLVCRHAQCDLATTTNILETSLARGCVEPFEPARINQLTGELEAAAHALCCTSDFTWAELQTLETKMDAFDARATTLSAYVRGTPSWRSDLYSNGDHILSHDASIRLFRSLNTAMTPELKSPSVPMPFRDIYSRVDYARAIVDAYRNARIPPSDVFLQSFDLNDHREWMAYAPEYARNAILGVGPSPDGKTQTLAYIDSLRRAGIRTVAPPVSMLLTLDEAGEMVATGFAQDLREAGLEIVAWTLERSGRVQKGRVEGSVFDFYLGSVLPSLDNDGDLYRVIHALNVHVGVRAIFSDWPATVTYYANCLGLE